MDGLISGGPTERDSFCWFVFTFETMLGANKVYDNHNDNDNDNDNNNNNNINVNNNDDNNNDNNDFNHDFNNNDNCNNDDNHNITMIVIIIIIIIIIIMKIMLIIIIIIITLIVVVFSPVGAAVSRLLQDADLREGRLQRPYDGVHGRLPLCVRPLPPPPRLLL